MADISKLVERVLVVDDDPAIGTLMERILVSEGVSVAVAAGGAQALAQLQAEFFPLVFLDIKMPDIDGLTVLQRLREIQAEGARSIVVVVTGQSSEQVCVQALRHGAQDYIAKPFTSDDVIQSVRRNMRVARLEAERFLYARTLEEKNKELERAFLQLNKAQQLLEAQNITLEKVVEEEMRGAQLSQAQLIQSAKMSAVGQLGAGVAHELNNPLTAVLGYAQLAQRFLQQAVLDDATRVECLQYAQYIEKEANRCKEIVGHLLHFSRKDPAQSLDIIDVRGVITDALKIARHQISATAIMVHVDAPETACRVRGSANRLQQMFVNIFLNACEAMKSGGTLSVAVRCETDARAMPQAVIVRVQDTGCGIAPKNIPHIFEPFFTTKDKNKGAGLGLYASYQIVQEHEGMIEVESQEHAGTVLSITLPAVKTA